MAPRLRTGCGNCHNQQIIFPAVAVAYFSESVSSIVTTEKGCSPILGYQPRSPSFHRYCKIRKANNENGASTRQAALNQMTNAAEPVVS